MSRRRGYCDSLNAYKGIETYRDSDQLKKTGEARLRFRIRSSSESVPALEK